MPDNMNIIKKIKRDVLIVEDEMINQEILSEILNDQFDILTATNGKEALDVLHNALVPISLILLDINMPVMGGFEFMDIIKQDERFKKIPIIVLTADINSELKSLELGAVDFIPKPYNMPEVIRARVNRSIELSEDRMIIQAAERDELTGVYNKHIFIEYASKMDQYHVDDNILDMVVLNLEKFHIYNELYGHADGDNALKCFAEVLKDLARRNDGIAGRLLSDYFLLYMKQQNDYEKIVNYIYTELENRFNITNLRFRLGVYHVEDKDEDIEERLDRAKTACDEIRGSNKTSFSIYDSEVEKDFLFKERLTQDIHKAIEERQLEVYYQPKIDIVGDKPVLVSAEALIRWNHPELGFISPGVFVPLFEENGLIGIVDRFVWKDVAKQIKIWKDKLNRRIPVSVNVSRIDMFDYSVVDTLLDIVNKAEISPNDLYLEITESAYNNETAQIIDIVNNFKSKGFKVEIDDFGSGYSSLNTLAILDFDVLKLDIKFVREMFTNEKAYKMVKIVSQIANVLGVSLIAEGVETKEQCDALKEIGYHIIQGYYFSKPLKVEDFELFLKKGY